MCHHKSCFLTKCRRSQFASLQRFRNAVQRKLPCAQSAMDLPKGKGQYCMNWSYIIIFRPPEHKKHHLKPKWGNLFSSNFMYAFSDTSTYVSSSISPLNVNIIKTTCNGQFLLWLGNKLWQLLWLFPFRGSMLCLIDCWPQHVSFCWTPFCIILTDICEENRNRN